MVPIDIDALFADLADGLGHPLCLEARQLAHRLRLVPIPNVPWSEVFKHRVTLAAPELLAEAMPNAERHAIRDATFAHMLAVIEAFGTDRMADGQVDASLALQTVLARLRSARDRSLAALATDTDGYARADGVSRQSISEERRLLSTAEPVTFARYQTLSLGKQAVGFPASLALCKHAGFDPNKHEIVRRLLCDVWLGLQYHDDVVDWEDDWRGGGAWAVSLARGVQTASREPATEPDFLHCFVLRSGVLVTMLDLARRRYRSARRRAQALGAHSLSMWAFDREATLTRLVHAERSSSGFALRERQLAALAREVFP